VDVLAGQGTMETYRCVYEILPFVATVANRGRSRCTGQDSINAAIAKMQSCPFSGP